MTDSQFHPSPVRGLLNRSWPLFRAARVDVRVSWTVVLIPLVFALMFAKWLPVGQALAWGLAWTLALYATTWSHEMGHIAMGRRLGIETETMTLRALGGLAHLQERAQSPRDDILISLAGPAIHLAWMAILFPVTWALDAAHGDEVWFWMLEGFAGLQLSMMVFNLLPVWPMDGGRASRSAFAFRVHSSRASLWASNLGFAGNGAFVVLGVMAWLGAADPLGYGPWGFLLAWIGIEGIQACRQLRLEAKYGDAYADHDSFQSTLLASQRAVREMEREDAKGRELESHSRRAADEGRRRLQETTDRLLDRINEVGGIDKLTPSERKELERASRALAKHRR